MSKPPIEIPKTGYVVAYRNNGSIFNNLIYKKQFAAGFLPKYAQYTHVEIVGIKHKDVRYSIHIVFPKVKLIDLHKDHRGRYVKILQYKDEHYEQWGRAKIAWLHATKCNTRYDIFGVLAFMFKWVRQNNRLWFCSEGVAADFKEFYPRCFPMPANKVMPAHFVASAQFEVVWEGTIE